MKFKEKAIMKLRLLLNAVTIEPLLICYVAGRAMCDPMLKNLELDKACYVNANYNRTVCTTITNGTFEQQNFTQENNLIQFYITNMHSWQISTSSIISMCIVLCLGTLSDHYRIRKPFLLFSITGQLFEFVGCMLCVHFMNQWPLEVLGVAQEIVLAIFGGEKLFLAITFAYITDITSEDNRTIKIAIVQGIYNICFGSGQSFTGAFLPKLGYIGILMMGTVLSALAFTYGIVFVEESSKFMIDQNKEQKVVTDLTPKHFLDTFKLFSKYKETESFNILTILIVLSISTIISYGEQSVMFLFTETAYNWTIRDYTYFFTITTVINTIGLVFAVPLFTQVFKLHDLLIVVAALINRIIVNIIYVTVRSQMGLYIGCSVAVLRILALVGIRSQLTKYVDHYDVGKVLALYTIVDSVSEGFASPIYNKGIYGPTQSTFPHAFFLLGIALSSVASLIVVIMYLKKRNQPKNVAGDTTPIPVVDLRRVSLDMQISYL